MTKRELAGEPIHDVERYGQHHGDARIQNNPSPVGTEHLGQSELQHERDENAGKERPHARHQPTESAAGADRSRADWGRVTGRRAARGQRHTFSTADVPRMPVGRTNRIAINRPKTYTSRKWGEA